MTNPESNNFERTDADTRTRQGFTYAELKTMIDEVNDKVYGERAEGVSITELEQRLTAELLEKLLNEKDTFKHVFRTENGSTYFVLDTGESFRIKRQKPDEWHKEYDMQPVTEHVFFIDPEDWKKLDDIRRNNRQFYTRFVGESATPEELEAFQNRKKIYEELTGSPVGDSDFRLVDSGREGVDRLIGEPIPTTELREGVIPFEIDMVEGGHTTIYKMEGNNLILMGRKDKDRDNEEDNISAEGVGSIHQGHPVTEIIK